MKKNNIVWTVLGIAILGIGIGASFTIFAERLSVVTLDINPSIELTVTKNEKIKSTRALNDDGNGIVSDDLNGMPLKEAIEEIAKRTTEKGYSTDGNLTVLLNISGKLTSAVLENDVRKAYEKVNQKVEIVFPLITEEALQKATEFNITPAKAAYIAEVVKSNEVLKFADLVGKSTVELSHMRETGLYCDNDYVLDGEKCYKKTSEEAAVDGKICPEGYYEKDKNCYKTVDWKEELYCTDGQRLENDKCVGTITVNAKPKCTDGTYNSKSDKCEILTYDSVGTKKCKSTDDLLLENGRCAQRHNGAHFDEPGATIDPATECCCGDTYKDGACYSLPNGNYDATVTCPNGTSYTSGDKGKACYKKTEVNPTYSCDVGYTVSGNKCISDKENTPKSKKTCETGFTLFENKFCINYKETADFDDGKICQNKNAKLEGDKCIIYDIVPAKSKDAETAE